MERLLRGALLGTGSISQFHMLAWEAIPAVEIVALANRTRSRAEEMGRRFGVPEERIYSDYRELLEREELDFVDISTAPGVHREQVLAAAGAGLHVLCQKPFAESIEHSLEMVEACELAGVRCVVNENWRWRRWYREIKELLDRGVIGAPRYARFQVHTDELLSPSPGTPPEILLRQPYLAGAPRLIVLDFGIHLLDTMRYLFGDVQHVYARTARTNPIVAGEDRTTIVLGFQGGLTGVVDLSWSTQIPPDRKWVRGSVDPFVVEGERGTIVLDPFAGDILSITTQQGTALQPARGSLTREEAYLECFVRAQAHFVNCLRTGAPAENDARDNLKTLAVVDAVYRSAQTGMPVVP